MATAQRRPRPFPQDLYCLTVAFAPLAALLTYKVFVEPRPFWVVFFDPEAIWFLNGLDIISWTSPRNIDHPGIPTSLLSALFVALAGAEPLAFDSFRLIAYVAVFLLNVLAGLLLLRTLLAGMSRPLQLTALWSYYLAPRALDHTTIWTSESLFPFFSVLPLVCISRLLRGSPSRRDCLLLGCSLGACIALKFTFITWLPAMVLLATCRKAESTWTRRSASALLVGAGASMGFVLLTLPIAHRYPYLLDWVVRLATRTGRHGSGAEGLPATVELAGRILDTIRHAKVWYLWIGALALGGAMAIQGRRERTDALVYGAGMLGFLAAQTLILRGELEMRYLLPAAPMSVLFVVVLSRHPWIAGSARFQQLTAGLIALLLVQGAVKDVLVHRARIGAASSWSARVETIIAERAKELGRPPVVVYGWRSPTPSFALRCFNTDPHILDLIEERYPNQGDYVPWRTSQPIRLPRRVETWDLFIARRQEARFEPPVLGSVIAEVDDYVVMVPAR